MEDCCWVAEEFAAALPDFESSHAEDVPVGPPMSLEGENVSALRERITP